MQGKNRRRGQDRRSQSELHLDLTDADSVSGGESPSTAESPPRKEFSAREDLLPVEDSAESADPAERADLPEVPKTPDSTQPADIPDAPKTSGSADPALPSPQLEDATSPDPSADDSRDLAGGSETASQPPAVFEFEDRGHTRRKRHQRPFSGSRSSEVPRPAGRSESQPAAPSESDRLELLEADAEHSDDPALLSELGQAYLSLGRYGQAEEWLRRAHRLDPERVEIRTRLGILAFRRGLCDQAEADLLWACEHDPQDSLAHLYRGEALNQLGRIDEAIEVVEIALRLNPEHPRPHYLMGILLDRKNRNQEASTMYRRARELAAR